MSDNVLFLDRRVNIRRISFLGVDFVPMNDNVFFRRVIEKSKTNEPFAYVVTPNVDHIVRLNKDKKLAPLYEKAWLCVSDSRILEIFAKISGINLPPCLGSDLAARLFAEDILYDEDVTIIGADKEVVDAVKEIYGLTNVNWYEPPMGLKNKPDEIRKCAQFIADHPARFHFLCVGAPQQEMVAKATLDLGKARGVGLCLGASLDFLAGKTERAPKIIQKMRLEWLHRLTSEPQRMWKRYLIDGPKIFSIWLRWNSQKNK